MDENVRRSIQDLIEKNRVILFMKGTKTFPQCGFSGAVVQILSQHGVPYETVNVLADDKVRQGIKDFSNWPTIPQLYVDGKFVGGCDIVRDLHAKGELATLLKGSSS